VKKSLVIFLFLASCTAGKKSNIDTLSHQLEAAEQALFLASEKVAVLRIRLYQEQIAAIRKKIESFDLNNPSEDLSSLFQEERKALTAMMEKERQVKKEAQEVLDLILRLITVLNSEQRF